MRHVLFPFLNSFFSCLSQGEKESLSSLDLLSLFLLVTDGERGDGRRGERGEESPLLLVGLKTPRVVC